MATFAELIEQAVARHGPPLIFRVGQNVRVRAGLDVNIYSVMNFLGKVGVVESVSVSPILKRVYYNVRIGDRAEPFEAWELDMRYARKRNDR